MSTISLPTTFNVEACRFTQQTNQRVSAAPFGGSEQAVDMLNDRWLCSLQMGRSGADDGAALEAFIAAMRGQTNVAYLYHFVRPAPRGTVRGTLTLSASAAQGAASISVTGCSPANGTLLQGDMLGVGGLLLMVATDCTASGSVITVPLVNRLRAAQSSGAAVTWNAPSAPFRLLASSGVNYVGCLVDATTLDFGEKI